MVEVNATLNSFSSSFGVNRGLADIGLEVSDSTIILADQVIADIMDEPGLLARVLSVAAVPILRLAPAAFFHEIQGHDRATNRIMHAYTGRSDLRRTTQINYKNGHPIPPGIMVDVERSYNKSEYPELEAKKAAAGIHAENQHARRIMREACDANSCELHYSSYFVRAAQQWGQVGYTFLKGDKINFDPGKIMAGSLRGGTGNYRSLSVPTYKFQTLLTLMLSPDTLFAFRDISHFIADGRRFYDPTFELGALRLTWPSLSMSPQLPNFLYTLESVGYVPDLFALALQVGISLNAVGTDVATVDYFQANDLLPKGEVLPSPQTLFMLGAEFWDYDLFAGVLLLSAGFRLALNYDHTINRGGNNFEGHPDPFERSLDLGGSIFGSLTFEPLIAFDPDSVLRPYFEVRGYCAQGDPVLQGEQLEPEGCHGSASLGLKIVY